MHILATILLVLSAIGVWAWRLNMARRGAGEVAKLAQAAANAPRRFAFRYRAGKSGLSLIQDPREAAAILLMEIALARGGPLTENQNTVITSEIMAAFNFSGDEAEELATHAAWVTNSAPPPRETMRKLSDLIMNASGLGPKEVVDLDGMLVAVSEAEGAPTHDQLQLLQLYRNRVGLKA